MDWQSWLLGNLPPGTQETSGYRSPQHNAAVGGSPNSYHTRGSVNAPGAIDIGGSAAALTALFETIKQQFAGRINELYLNLPGGTSQDIRNNQAISSNPEAGNPQHLHVALNGGGPSGTAPPAAGIDPANRGEKAVETAGGDCARSVCAPKVLGGGCLCWSDVWFYSAAVGLVVGGGLMLVTGRGK